MSNKVISVIFNNIIRMCKQLDQNISNILVYYANSENYITSFNIYCKLLLAHKNRNVFPPKSHYFPAWNINVWWSLALVHHLASSPCSAQWSRLEILVEKLDEMKELKEPHGTTIKFHSCILNFWLHNGLWHAFAHGLFAKINSKNVTKSYHN